jgi:hypothetical protein
MKKLFYRFSSSRSFAILFSLMACTALGSLFAQQADAQDFFFGWEPFPPSSWDGGWDASLKCEALDGTTTLTRGSTDTVVQDGTVSCTFKDTGRTPIFQETAICKLHIQIDKLTESCDNNANPPNSKLTVTGTCPVATIPEGEGTIDCSGAGPGGADPNFCKYAGTDPTGNTSGDCIWNVGFGALKGQKVVPLTQTQCQAAFGSSREVFSFNQILEGKDCKPSAQVVAMGGTSNNLCHSDTWDGSQKAFCDFAKGAVKNTATGAVENFLTADTEYSPNTINADCRPGKDQGDITLIILGNNSDQGTNSIAVQAIKQDSITVNSFAGFPVFKANSCSFSNPDTLQCRVPSCVQGHSVIENTKISGTNTATLTMDALLNDGTRVVGDVEKKKFVQ